MLEKELIIKIFLIVSEVPKKTTTTSTTTTPTTPTPTTPTPTTPTPTTPTPTTPTPTTISPTLSTTPKPTAPIKSLPTTNTPTTTTNNENKIKTKHSLASAFLVSKEFQKIVTVIVQDEKKEVVIDVKKKEKPYLDDEDEVLPMLKLVIDKRKEEAPLYCHSYHTCYSESIWNVRASKISKRICHWKYFDAKSKPAFIQTNYGKTYPKKVFESLMLNERMSVENKKIIDNFLEKKEKKKNEDEREKQNTASQVKSNAIKRKKEKRE